MKKRIENLTVIENRRLNEEFYVLKLYSDQSLPEILPGQFAEVKVTDCSNAFLRRPISIYDVDYKNNNLDLLIKIAGNGTARLSELEEGNEVDLIFPLGNSFSIPTGRNVLLIGGGTGVAPLLLLGKYLKKNMNVTPVFLLGYRSKDLIVERRRFEALGKVHITTEDGSEGYKGYVTQHPLIKSNPIAVDNIYTCGPEIMMKAVAKIAYAHGITCEVSLENLMGCGFGACLCCVVDTFDEGNVNTCTDGPVFNTQRLRWQT